MVQASPFHKKRIKRCEAEIENDSRMAGGIQETDSLSRLTAAES